MTRRLTRLLRIRGRQRAIEAARHRGAAQRHAEAARTVAALDADVDALVGSERPTRDLVALCASVQTAQTTMDRTNRDVDAQARCLHRAAVAEERAKRLLDRARDDERRAQDRAEQVRLDEFSGRRSR